MAFHGRTGKAVVGLIKRGFKSLGDKAKRDAAARQKKREGANPFGNIRRLDPEPTRTAQDRRRAGR